jgi:hypothetical protein
MEEAREEWIQNSGNGGIGGRHEGRSGLNTVERYWWVGAKGMEGERGEGGEREK